MRLLRSRGFDAELYQGRNVVERSFNTTKQWCGLAISASTSSPSSTATRPS